MSQYRLWGTVLLVPVLAVMVSTLGCGGGDTGKPKDGGKTSDGGKSEGDGRKKVAAADKTALEATGTATLKGKVTYEGDPPPRKDLTPQIEQQEDRNHCKKGDTKDPLWIVDATDKGVANVVVWLRAPQDKYFKIPADQQTYKGDPVTMDQPFCAFQPHVVAFNPSVWDPQTKKQKPTGMKLQVLNSAPMNHNTAYGGNQLLNPVVNRILPTKKDMDVDAKPCRDSDVGGEELLNVSCDIHKWMTAKIAVFDHPYYAVTDAHGNYEIKNAPAGAEVTIAIWHESMETLRKAMTKKVTLKAGDNPPEDFKVK